MGREGVEMVNALAHADDALSTENDHTNMYDPIYFVCIETRANIEKKPHRKSSTEMVIAIIQRGLRHTCGYWSRSMITFDRLFGCTRSTSNRLRPAAPQSANIIHIHIAIPIKWPVDRMCRWLQFSSITFTCQAEKIYLCDPQLPSFFLAVPTQKTCKLYIPSFCALIGRLNQRLGKQGNSMHARRRLHAHIRRSRLRIVVRQIAVRLWACRLAPTGTRNTKKNRHQTLHIFLLHRLRAFAIAFMCGVNSRTPEVSKVRMVHYNNDPVAPTGAQQNRLNQERKKTLTAKLTRHTHTRELMIGVLRCVCNAMAEKKIAVHTANQTGQRFVFSWSNMISDRWKGRLPQCSACLAAAYLQCQSIHRFAIDCNSVDHQPSP